MTSLFRPCAVVPTRNHHRELPGIVSALRARNLPVFIIDDGSDDATQRALSQLHAPGEAVHVVRRDGTPGKGAAVCKGFRLASAEGFTHVAQIDADGQHDLAALPRLLDLAASYPEALICGRPIFDDSVPRARALGRWITNLCVWFETLSFRIPDAMCGFRVYPTAPVAKLLEDCDVGRRMDFDTDILVRLFWQGVPVVDLPVCVRYPEGNTSNFDMLKDNWCITRMHTRLMVSMLWRLPGILRHRPVHLTTTSHWSTLSERGASLGLWFAAGVCRMLGRRGALVILSPVVLFFYLTGSRQRRASREFLTRAFIARGERAAPSWGDGYRHFLSFAACIIDTFAAWAGQMASERLQPEDAGELCRLTGDAGGALLIVSHVGSAHVARALLDRKSRERLSVLVHTRNAQRLNNVLGRFNPEATINLLQVTEVGPASAILLRERIEHGGWIAVAGDRTPVSGDRRVVSAKFLGDDAQFAEGPIVLASLLGCPVYLLFCLRKRGRYHLIIERFADRIELDRRDRKAQIQLWVERYARALERYAVAEPFQWFNFFPFWAR